MEQIRYEHYLKHVSSVQKIESNKRYFIMPNQKKIADYLHKQGTFFRENLLNYLKNLQKDYNSDIEYRFFTEGQTLGKDSLNDFFSLEDQPSKPEQRMLSATVYNLRNYSIRDSIGLVTVFLRYGLWGISHSSYVIIDAQNLPIIHIELNMAEIQNELTKHDISALPVQFLCGFINGVLEGILTLAKVNRLLNAILVSGLPKIFTESMPMFTLSFQITPVITTIRIIDLVSYFNLFTTTGLPLYSNVELNTGIRTAGVMAAIEVMTKENFGQNSVIEDINFGSHKLFFMRAKELILAYVTKRSYTEYEMYLKLQIERMFQVIQHVYLHSNLSIYKLNDIPEFLIKEIDRNINTVVKKIKINPFGSFRIIKEQKAAESLEEDIMKLLKLISSDITLEEALAVINSGGLACSLPDSFETKNYYLNDLADTLQNLFMNAIVEQ